MLQTCRTYFIAIVTLLAGLLNQSCGAGNGLQTNSITQRAIESNPAPNIEQLAPWECPWDENFKKRSMGHKEYGDDYANKQNRRMEDAL